MLDVCVCASTSATSLRLTGRALCRAPFIKLRLWPNLYARSFLVIRSILIVVVVALASSRSTPPVNCVVKHYWNRVRAVSVDDGDGDG